MPDGRSSSGGRGKSKPTTPSSRPRTPPPRPSPPRSPPPQRGSAGSTFRDMAAIAGGVAVGSAVGTAAGNAITGAVSGAGGADGGGTDAGYAGGPCDYDLYEFVQCTDANQEDLNTCGPLNKKYQDCKKRNNLK